MIDPVPHTAAAAREYVAGWYAGTVSASSETIHAALWIAGERRRDPLEQGGDHWDFLAESIEWECRERDRMREYVEYLKQHPAEMFFNT